MCRPCGQIDFLGLSTADHEVNDPAITRYLQRALAGKYDRPEVVILFMLCSADPDGLLTHSAALQIRRGFRAKCVMITVP